MKPHKIDLAQDVQSPESQLIEKDRAKIRKLLARKEAVSANSSELVTGDENIDLAWQLAQRDIQSLRRTVKDENEIPVSRFNAGEGWHQAWTRDTSYAADLGLIFLYPQEIRASLDVSTQGHDDEIVALQDKTLHFKGWPNITDRIVWALGAQEWRLAASPLDNPTLLKDYRVVANTLKRAEEEAVFDPKNGLFRGVASFMESHSSYPKRFGWPFGRDNSKIGQTKALSTNALYFHGYRVAASMASVLGSAESQEWSDKSENLREAVVKNFKSQETGNYNYFIDETGKPDTHFEGLGNLLVCRTGLEEKDCKGLLNNIPRQTYGTPCLWPQYPEWTSWEKAWPLGMVMSPNFYHNGMMWPFVEGYAGWMAARNKGADQLLSSLNKLSRLAVHGKTFHEFYHFGTGRPGGSKAQLWSAAGYTSLVLRGLLGMETTEDRLNFSPLIPKEFSGTLKLTCVRYRGAILDILVKGNGSRVQTVKLDGLLQSKPEIPDTLQGQHRLEITLSDEASNTQS